MSLLKSVQVKGVRGVVALSAAKPLNGSPKAPTLRQVGTVGAVPGRASGLRAGGLMKQAVVAPSSLLQSLGVRRLGGNKLGF